MLLMLVVIIDTIAAVVAATHEIKTKKTVLAAPHNSTFKLFYNLFIKVNNKITYYQTI